MENNNIVIKTRIIEVDGKFYPVFTTADGNEFAMQGTSWVRILSGDEIIERGNNR